MFFSSMILSMSAPSGGVFLQKEKAEYAQAHSTCDAVPTAADRDTARRPNGFESFLKAKMTLPTLTDHFTSLCAARHRL